MTQIHQYTLVIAMITLVYSPLQAQQDPAAERYLQAVSDQFSLDEGYRIHMDYVREDLMRETYAEGEGTIWMKGIKYKIVIDEYIIYYDGNKLYSQNTEAGEVYVSTPDPEEPGYFYSVPIKIIKSYQQDFKYQYMGRAPFNGKDCFEVRLYPKELSGPYSMIQLYLDPNTLKLEGTRLRHKEGILYTMVLSEVEGGLTFPDGMFVFDPAAYPDTEVIELIE
jgi:outer membrane lipoprotein-sorting protein